MSSQGLLRKLESALGVLKGTSFEELDNSLLVAGDSPDLRNNLADKFDSLSECTFASGRSNLLAGFVGSFEFGDSVSFVPANGDHSWVSFSHN